MKDFKKPIIIIIDSFEEFPKNNTIWLYNYNNNSLQQIGNGLWHSLNKTVWIISGRDKLNLTIENEWSSEYVSFFELTNFSKNDTTNYLIKRNLSTEQSAIFFKNTSEGDPLLSFLLSNQLLENNNQIEILLSDTVKEKHRKDILISRYLRYIEGEDNKETNSRIKMLIALGSFTKEEICNSPQKIRNRLFQNSNTEDIDSFLKRSFITKYSEEYFSVHKCIKELFLSETYPDFHSRHGQQLIDDYTKCDAIEYLATKFSESKPMNKNDIIQIIRLVNTFKNIDSNEKWKKLTEEYGYFKDYLDFLNTNNKDLDLINFYLIMFYEFDLSSLSNETILVSLKKIIELYYFKYLVYYYNDISSLLLLLPESVQNTEYVATHFYNIGNFSKAKEIFLNLLELYPNRMRLLLCLAYCEVYLDNKDEAMSYVKKVKPGQDYNYNLNTDDISEDQIIDVYYALKEYDVFLNLCGDCVEYYYIAEWEEYFYVLWLKNQKERFFSLEEKNRKYFEEAINEAIVDEDYDSEKEKQETIASWEEDKRKFEEMIFSIKSGASRPEIKLKLYPEYSCFMVDCVRHKFI